MSIFLAVFDLDGTLVSSHETIYKATIEALHRVGVHNHVDQNKFNRMIGWHFEDMFNELGFSVPNFEEFISIYKPLYFDFINHSYLYEGVIETLQLLKEKKIFTALLTTKAHDQAQAIINYFGLRKHIDCVTGRIPGIPHKPSPVPLLKICDEFGVETTKTIMIGDTEMDVECGKNAGTKTCAVTYGYRSKEDLVSLNPDFVIDTLSELQQIVE